MENEGIWECEQCGLTNNVQRTDNWQCQACFTMIQITKDIQNLDLNHGVGNDVESESISTSIESYKQLPDDIWPRIFQFVDEKTRSLSLPLCSRYILLYTKTRKNKKWEKWEEDMIINERKKIKENSKEKIPKISDSNWKSIALKLESETKRKQIAGSGRTWTAIRSHYNTKIRKDIKVFPQNDGAGSTQNERNSGNIKIREKFKKIEDFRGTFIGIFSCFGGDKGNNKASKKKNKYICLTEIRLNNYDEILCDHVWMNVGKQMKELGVLRKGIDKIQFDGTITAYSKGKGVDYQCSMPRKVMKSLKCDN